MKVKHFLFIFIVLVPFFLSNCQNTENNSAQDGISENITQPSPQQVDYQKKEKVAFVHFGVNTFTNREWGTGKEDPSIFNPEKLDAEQWAKTLSENGFETLILTAKHHDGFCLWPSKYTEHDIANSPYKNGNGDIVKEVSEACEKYDIDLGLYLSPWDKHEETYGTPEYNEYYLNQLKELLTNYGDIAEVWFDGAKGEDAKDMTYNFDKWWSTVRELQPDALIFSDEGPDIRWIGNEHGFAGETNWSTVNRDSITIGKAGQGEYLNTGEAGGPDWVVGECDVSIRPGWFFHEEENEEVKTVAELTEIYMKSVGRNCTLLLNIPPNKDGQFHPTDVKRLYAFSDTLETMFDENLIGNASIEANHADASNPASQAIDGNWDTFWAASNNDATPQLTLTFDEPVTFNLLELQEYIPLGQRISSFSVSARVDGSWQSIAEETTVGYKRLLQLDETTADAIRISFDDFLNRPTINEISLYHAGESSTGEMAIR
ncbi:alpha-L-fucosidase [Fodinibius salsisoli]|uniref:alpha-L-fucosidase n=1 Tax=Fodinibius salsisoli TaxID=2820877 RepID=A0ABT3PPQ0_9BACT|nr:alpha-L-fucosidase [Fodinibius salsisoli]MCW9707827.1 alpha-L-fucosidase [Fodinibius salsisoli]